MTGSIIDLWDLSTFDAALLARLGEQRALLIDYYRTSRTNFLAREASDRRGPPTSNPYAGDYLAFVEDLATDMAERTIRAWHYTRLTDHEIGIIRAEGICPATLETVQQRIAGLVASGDLAAEEAQFFFDSSPFHDDEFGGRNGKFWMVSHPLPRDDGGVTSLLAHWGGESVYFNHHEGDAIDKLSSIGRARVLEIAVPLHVTRHVYDAARSVTQHYGRSLGCHTDWGMFDLYAAFPLSPDAVLRVHSHGETDFGLLGRSYPQTFKPREEMDRVPLHPGMNAVCSRNAP